MICVGCEHEKRPEETGWCVGREGEDLCPKCAEDARSILAEMVAKLPQRIGLCPSCAPEFYYALADGENLMCPQCGLTMAPYERVIEASAT